MGKKCATEGCNNEVQAWQTFCVSCYAKLMQQQSGGAVVEQPPLVPTQKVTMPQQRQATAMPSDKPLPQFTQQKTVQKTEQVGEMMDKEKMIRKECLKCAVDLMIGTADMNKPYEELIGQIATLVEDFYRIVSGTFKK
jgi:hypothetical protein